MDAYNTVLLIVTLANFSLAGFVLWHRPQAEINRVFAITSASTALWALTNALFRAAASVPVAVNTAQWSYLAAVILGASILHFSWIFPLQREVPRYAKIVLWSLALFIGVLPFIPRLVIQTVTLDAPRSIQTTPLIYLIAAFLVATIGWAFVIFLKHHPSLRRAAREQSRYVLTGLGMATVLGMVCNLLLPLLDNYRFIWLGPASSLFFVAFTVYAIIAHHLFDIRLIIKKTLVYSLLLAAVGAGYSVAEHSVKEFLGRIVQNSEYAWLGNIVGAFVVAALFSPVKGWLEKKISDFLYRDKAQQKVVK